MTPYQINDRLTLCIEDPEKPNTYKGVLNITVDSVDGDIVVGNTDENPLAYPVIGGSLDSTAYCVRPLMSFDEPHHVVEGVYEIDRSYSYPFVCRIQLDISSDTVTPKSTKE